MRSTDLVRYDTARRALAAALRVDEVKDIRDKAVAMQIYAKQAKDGVLIANATEIRKRAERRLGEMMRDGKEDRAGHGGDRKSKVSERPLKPTLTDQGIDKHLADRARKAAAMPEDKFEAHVAHAVKVAVAATEDDRRVVNVARAGRQAEKRARRQQREHELGAKLTAMPDKRYGVVYADPPWSFQVYSDDSGSDRSASNHYPTMDLAAIKALPIPAADDSVLFLWSTVPLLPGALEVMAAWGFTYTSNIVWTKNKTGTGYWVRNRHEHLLIGTRGRIPAPVPGTQSASVIEAPVGKHSAKPECFRRLIEDLFPTLPRLELFAREQSRGWDLWGNEAPT